ncbi:MAG: heterodisulfide reductase subunit A-like protein [Candidatus Atribacteria bacterium]|nr:heterodisulfide reductase subunit A-like protein [Candidatus Atribacteria bacterium]
MAKKGLLLCVCQGTCPSFHKMNIFEVLNEIRREKLVDVVAVHPQLCADDGDQFLESFLSGHQIDKLYVAGCSPTMQEKMFRDSFARAGFELKDFVGIEIRNLDTPQAIEVIKKALIPNGKN